MTTQAMLAENRTDQVLVGAVARRTPIMISHRTSSGWRVYHARFTLAEPGSDVIHAVLETSRAPAPAPYPGTGSEVGVTFRHARKKCSFRSVIVESSSNPSAPWVLRWPEYIRELQRRVFERTCPPDGTSIPVRFWRLADEADGTVDPGTICAGEVDDLSVGGVRVRAEVQERYILDETYCCRIRLEAQEEELALEAVLRHRGEPEGGTTALGFRFIGLEMTEAGQRNMITLARTVSRFQRRRSNASKIRLHRRRRSR